MRRSITAPLVVLVALGGLVVPAHAGSIAGTLSGDATLTPTGTPGVFTQNFTGEGDDSNPLLGSFTVQATSFIDFSNLPNIIIRSGTVSETFSQGTLFGTSTGSGTASGMGTAAVTLDLFITGGSGFFAGGHGRSDRHGDDHQHQRDDGVGHRVLCRVAFERPRTEYSRTATLPP